MSSLVGKQVEQITSGAFAACLKVHGYRKKGRTFHRRAEQSVCVVNVQASQSNVGSTGKFTINLGVYFPAVEEPITGGANSDPPSESNCTLRQRLGGLMPGAHDDRSEQGGALGSISRAFSLKMRPAEAQAVLKVQVFGHRGGMDPSDGQALHATVYGGAAR